MRQEVLTPEKLSLQYSDIFLTTQDGQNIHGWHLPSKKTNKGNLVFFHGNAQNISTHIASIHWLPEMGYDVYLFDYRGYGRSSGNPHIEGVMLDAKAVLDYVTNDLNLKNIIVFGQSLGGAIALNAVADSNSKENIKSVIIDSSFSSFREIAKEKLSSNLFTWLFQYPFSFAFTDKYKARDAAARISPIPLLILHGNADETIPIHHGRDIFYSAQPPKMFWEIDSGRHIDSMSKQKNRNQLLIFLDNATNNLIPDDLNKTKVILSK